jgi:hypothetical protein
MDIKQITNHLWPIVLLITGITTLQVYSQPANLVLQDTTIASVAHFAARNSITAGRNVTITNSGDVTFRTGGYVYFKPGSGNIVIIQGGKLRTILDTTLTSVRPLETPLPATFNLQQNYPNPFNPSTSIRFAVKEKSHVLLSVFNLLGQSVANLVNQELPTGEYEVSFSPNAVASGVYVYRMTADGFVESRTMLLLK